VVTLEMVRSRLRDVGLKRAVGAANHGLVVDDFFAIQNHRRMPVHDGDLVALPSPNTASVQRLPYSEKGL
jgi:hypothetical protein